MVVALLQLFSQGQVIVVVAVHGGLHDGRQPGRREAGGHGVGEHLAHPGHLGGGVFGAQVGR